MEIPQPYSAMIGHSLPFPTSAPLTPPNEPVHDSVHSVSADDLDLLDELTAPNFSARKFRPRESIFDPLVFAAAVSSGPHITRHHYHHIDSVPTDPVFGIFGNVEADEELTVATEPAKPKYVSRQKPRSERLKDEEVLRHQQQAAVRDINTAVTAEPPSTLVDEERSFSPKPSIDSIHQHDTIPKHHPPLLTAITAPISPLPIPAIPVPGGAWSALTSPASRVSREGPLQVWCRARTRIPTPHGPAFLHLYHNNWDTKEHLAVVVDPAQLLDEPSEGAAPAIRSRTLDSVWHDQESEMERLVRGAYVGKLSPTSHTASSPASSSSAAPSEFPVPLVRIHSECFTGETIGSMRCDCGEQLDEAIRLISQPQTLSSGVTIPGRGAVVYLRQEGRGIGLLEKIRAYNLQDLGHDTVTANLLLGHGADERGYDIAAAILKDLGMGPDDGGIRLLTNNPEKLEAMKKEGIHIVERIPMVPRSWKCGDDQSQAKKLRSKRRAHRHREDENDASESDSADDDGYALRRGGATMIGATATYGPELEKYLRTKVQRMGHMIDLPSSSSSTKVPTPTATPSDDEEVPEHMSMSLPSLIASTPDLESDQESVGDVEH